MRFPARIRNDKRACVRSALVMGLDSCTASPAFLDFFTTGSCMASLSAGGPRAAARSNVGCAWIVVAVVLRIAFPYISTHIRVFTW